MYVTKAGLERSRKIREAKIKILARELDEIEDALEKLAVKKEAKKK